MEKAEVSIAFEKEKLEALEYCLRKERTSVQKQMDEALRQLYESKVPEPVREYLESKTAPASRPRRIPRPNQSKPERPRMPETPGGEAGT